MTDQKDFEQVLIDAGIPTTEDSAKTLWDGIVKAQGFEVSNNSPFSPFWRLLKAIATAPLLLIVKVLTTHIMPNTFVLTSKDQWLDNHGASRNTPRLKALKAQGNVQITRVDGSEELVIPAGTIIQSSPINNIVYQVKTLYDTTLAVDELSQLALVEALTEGTEQNLTGGYYNAFAVPIEGVSVVNLENWLISPGQDIESNENYQLRQRDKFATLGKFHVDAVYRAIICEFPGMLAENVAFERNAPRGAGSANAYVHLAVGSISDAAIDVINAHITSGNHGNGDDLVVYATPTQGQNITLDYWLHANEADIATEIEQFIRAAFRENSAYKATVCNVNSTFSFSLLASELHNQFPGIKSLKFTNADIETALWLPVIDSLTLNKQA